MCGVLILNVYTRSSVVLIIKTVVSNFEYVKYSSLLNTLRGNCFDDGQYVYCMNSRYTLRSINRNNTQHFKGNQRAEQHRLLYKTIKINISTVTQLCFIVRYRAAKRHKTRLLRVVVVHS